MKLMPNLGNIFKKKEFTDEEKPSLIPEPKILYLCDRLACKDCSYPMCKHTGNIAHAKNFQRVVLANTYEEREPDENAVKIFPDLEVIYE